MGEVIRGKYRGRGVGFVQTGAAVGPGLAALVYAGLYAILPEAIAWRALFAVGILPALLVLWIRRGIPESEAFQEQRDSSAQPGIAHLLSAFRGPYLWLTIKVSLMVMGAQGGVWAVNFWMPTYLRTVRHLSASGTGLYVAVQAFGALIGFLIGAYLADAIGRKWTFMISAIATIVMVLVYLYVSRSDLSVESIMPDALLPRPGSLPGWTGDLTRVPFWVYRDQALMKLEQGRVFEGPVWNFLCLENEIDSPGDWRSTVVGEMPVVVVRDNDGSIAAFENRCAHRGALICLDNAGSGASDFQCVYHAWRYDLPAISALSRSSAV